MIGLEANSERAPGTVRETSWSDQYSKLQAFHARNGHCTVSRKLGGDRLLGQWVMEQRRALRTGKLKPDRTARLGAIGFQADPLTEKWNAMCTKLEAYHTRYGQCYSPCWRRTDPALREWVYTQRKQLEKGTLRHERAARLNRIGFRL